MMTQNSIVIYETEKGQPHIEVMFERDTLWLSLLQIAELFERDKSVISRHLKNVFDAGELLRDSVVAKNATTATDGKIVGANNYFFLHYLPLQSQQSLKHHDLQPNHPSPQIDSFARL